MSNPTTVSPALSALPFTVANSIKDGHFSSSFMYSTIMSCIIVSVITALVTKVDVLVNWMSSIVSKLYGSANYWGIILFNRIMKKQLFEPKTCVISLISDDRSINELYAPIDWYLTSNLFVDYSKETPLNMALNKKVDQFEVGESVKLKQSIAQGQVKYITYKDIKIAFSYSTEVITLFIDKERKKENKKITLTTMINKTIPDHQVILANFCEHCVSEYTKYIKTKTWIPQVFMNKECNWSKTAFDNKRMIETIVLKNNKQMMIKEDISKFMNGSDFYQKTGTPYKRGYLFYGRPGTGKTSMIRAISNFTKRDVYYVNLNDIRSDDNLFDLMRNIPHNKAIVVFEDIDCATSVVKKRVSEHPNPVVPKDAGDKQVIVDVPCKPTDNKSGITLTGLFNVIDGVFDSYGRIMIMTTNHPEVLDEGLYRPGRIDVKVEFGNCDRQQIAQLYKLYYDKDCDSKKLEAINENKYSPAYIGTLFMGHITEPDTVLDHIDDDYVIFGESVCPQFTLGSHFTK